MASSLARSLRSLAAGIALLLAAFAIAASPTVGEYMPAPWQKRAALTAPVHQLSRDLGVNTLRHGSPEAARAAAQEPLNPQGLGLLALSMLGLAVGVVWRRWPSS